MNHYRVEADVIDVLQSGWAYAVITRNLSRDSSLVSAPIRGERVAVPKSIKVVKGNRIMCKIVPNRSPRSSQKWFAIYCQELVAKDVPPKVAAWCSWQDGENSLILQLPSTKPGSLHQGIELACWKCGQRIVESDQIYCIRNTCIWTKRMLPPSHLRVDQEKDFNDVKKCDVQKVRCICSNVVGSFYENPYAECDEGQLFPCFKLISVWEKRKWHGKKPSFAMVLLGGEKETEQHIGNLEVTEEWHIEKHFLVGGRLDKEGYIKMEEAMIALRARAKVEAESSAAAKAAEAEAAANRANELEQLAAQKVARAEELVIQAERLSKSKCEATTIVWECETERQWSQYPSHVGTILDSCFAQKTTAEFSLKKQRYEVDCSAPKLVQRNITTGFQREVRRREVPLDIDVSWECCVDGDWIKYPQDVSHSLETHYRQQSRATFRISSRPYEIDFRLDKLVQRNVESGMQRPVCRRENISTPVTGIPDTWENNPMGQNCMFVSLSRDSVEWDAVQTSLTTTLPNAQLHDVLRVQNSMLWEYFCFREDRVRKLSQGGNSNVVRVWHGTRSNDPKAICEDKEDGFMMQHSSAGMWGQGIYFAVDAKYSHAYAHTESRFVPGGARSAAFSGRFSRTVQLYTLIMARLVVGEEVHMTSNSALRQCPAKPGEEPRRYDTVTGTTKGTKVYVVYENGRAYPEYLVTYSISGPESK